MRIRGYASAVSVAPGDAVDFMLSTDTPGSTVLTVERVGGGAAATLTLDLRDQPEPAARGWEGFGWEVSHTFTVPSWPSGLYRMTEAATGDVLAFVVRPVSPGATSRILFYVDFLTPQAYNNAGGKSLYFFNSAPDLTEASRASLISLDRPGAVPDRERPLIEWLAGEGVTVEYCAGTDFTDPSLLSGYDCLLVSGHAEYWTFDMRDLVERFVANGGNLIVLSGNTCYRQVRLERDGRMLVFHKYAGADPEPDGARATVAFAEPPVNRPQNEFLGVGFTYGAFDGGPSGYALHFPTHWALTGVGAATTSAFMAYETDAVSFVDDEGYPRVTGEEGTPRSFVVLGSSDLRSWGGKPGYATMGVLVNNGTVFAAGTTEWVSALSTDPVVAAITRNVLTRLSRRVPWDWEQIGHAIDVRALTALGPRLFAATADNRLWRRHPVGADVPWLHIGQADDVVAMAGSGDTLFCVTATNDLWWRPPVEAEMDWTAIGTGPPAGTRALAAAGGLLYAVDDAGQLWRRPATRASADWVEVATFGQRDPTVNALAAHSDILFASTTDMRLLRSDRDWINESGGWVQIHHCHYSAGLAVVDGLLFVATTENLLWRIDLHGLRQP